MQGPKRPHGVSWKLRTGILLSIVLVTLGLGSFWQSSSHAQKSENPPKNVKFVKPHEMTLQAGTEFHVGSQGSLVAGVQGVVSITETLPIPGADVTVTLRDGQGKAHVLYTGKTGSNGLANASFDIPELPAGNYKLEIHSKSPGGEEKLEREIRLKSETKILLVSDKPIYQPGQTMHLRALVLRPFDMKPIAKKTIEFEVEDSKGNKVFKRSLETSEFGVAALDFDLADEVNNGNYHIRANVGDTRAEKTVDVKKYVLPRFKTSVTTDKKFYLPKEKIEAELQADYFFGKPVAKGKIEVTAHTFDVAFREFQKWRGETDEKGHAKFTIQLPDYFVGQPLQQGNALVKLDVKLLDSADHSEAIVKNLTVSDQPIKLSLIPEGGRIQPGVENRVFAAAIYPDGTPAPNVEVQFWLKHVNAPQANAAPLGGGPIGRPIGRRAPGFAGNADGQNQNTSVSIDPKTAPKEAPLAKVTTNDAGLAEFKVTPKADQLRQHNWGNIDIETLGGKQATFGPQMVLDVVAHATDAKGKQAASAAILNATPFGENVQIRLDKAVYKTGDRMTVNIHSSAGVPTVFIDMIRGGQVLLSKWTEVKDGKASHVLDIPTSVFGSVEVHAYQMFASGEIVRDSRVVYIQQKNDLKIEVAADKNEYKPGESGRIRFTVTDSSGKPTQAALGVVVVDEAVYALQEMQPGLEKVYFTLQEELMKPQVQIKLSPGEQIDNIVIQPAIPAPRQQIAEVLLTAVKLPAPARWNVDPALGRKQAIEGQIVQVAQVLFANAFNQPEKILKFDAAGKASFNGDVLAKLEKESQLPAQLRNGFFGGKLTAEEIGKVEPGFSPDSLARAITLHRMENMRNLVASHAFQQRAKYFVKGQWTLPPNVLDLTSKQFNFTGVDAWGRPLKLVYLDKGDANFPNDHPLKNIDVQSMGADGRLGSKDDLRRTDGDALRRTGWVGHTWWMNEQKSAAVWTLDRSGVRRNMLGEQGQMMRFRNGMAPGMGGGFGGGGPFPPGAVPMMEAAAMPMAAAPAGRADFAAKKAVERRAGAAEMDRLADPGQSRGADAGGSPEPTRTREYFPETMLWQPALITDAKGQADLSVNFADSITTWRLTASGNSLGGLLGGSTTPLKVFQDFFVELDLPVHLTQADEVAFPVAVYNYLKTPQSVKLVLEDEPWFELLDKAGLTRTIDVKANEVTSVTYRIRAKKIGMQPLSLKAYGSKQSDAVKRIIEVVPNGQKTEKVFTDKLATNVSHTINVPQDAVPDASKLLVRMYPGVMAQIMEGLEGMLRMPGGCFEQTSSSAYPNIMIVDYIKRAKLNTPDLLLKSEQYLNVGYQRLLTFERPGGGFDWWGSGEPLIWLSAYGLQEFSDMARVYPIDKGIIHRTQAFLMNKRDKDATWSNIGATHGETIASMGNPKLLLTSYVTWSLLESGYDKAKLADSVKYIRDNLQGAEDNPYILALAANALATFDAKDAVTLDCVQKLDKLRKELPEWKAIVFPCRGTSLTYARGDSLNVETTALAALAMLKTGGHTNSINQALTYLVKSKEGNGTWGSTQATILALKALSGAMGGNTQKGVTNFTVLVNGKEAATGKIDPDNADVLQAFDLKKFTVVGDNQVEIKAQGAESNLMYQVVGRYFLPHKDKEVKKSPVEVEVTYDRTELSTRDVLKAKATLKYNGQIATSMLMLDLGIAPGFTVDPGEFAEMVAAKKVNKFTTTQKQVTLYLGDMKPGETLTFEYTLRPKFPVRVQTPATVAYEYYTPANRAESRPVQLVVQEKK